NFFMQRGVELQLCAFRVHHPTVSAVGAAEGTRDIAVIVQCIHGVEANTEDTGIRISRRLGDLCPLGEGPAFLRKRNALFLQQSFIVVDRTVTTGVGKDKEAEVLAIERVTSHDSRVDVVVILGLIGSQEDINLQVDAHDKVEEQPAMMAIEQVLESTRDEASL